MKSESIKFRVMPSVVEADRENIVKIRSLDGTFKFYDDVTYSVQFIPMEESDVTLAKEMKLLSFDDVRKTYRVKPKNGEITLKYFFAGEQEWKIHISAEDYGEHINPIYEKYEPYWNHLLTAHQRGIEISVYSLKPDLYKRRVLRGDLHIHTYRSDGQESPELVSAEYRKAGYDFIALTDHNLFDSAKFALEKFDFATDFKIMRAEEVHNGIEGLFHMVNIGGKYSVNDIYLNDPERVEAEMTELEKEITIPEGLNKREYLGRVWLYREIKKSGGFAIYPHPYWRVWAHYHTETRMSEAVIKNKLCDAYEVLGGVGRNDDNLQAALYYKLKAEGVNVPIVGSTDTHSTLSKNGCFNTNSTLVFCENDDVLDAVSNGYSVAVEHPKGENVRVYGDFRLVKYAHFVLENYFPMHNELCFSSGKLTECYVLGNKKLKNTIETIENLILDFEKEFFAR